MTFMAGGSGGSGSLSSSSDVALNNPADSEVLTYDGETAKWLNAPAPASGAQDATADSKGAIQLAGDLGGTASAPTVPGLANKVSGQGIDLIQSLSQAEYDALTEKSETTLYVIVD